MLYALQFKLIYIFLYIVLGFDGLYISCNIFFFEQMYTQNVSIPPDYFTWRSAVPSQSDTELSWREENAVNDQQKLGNFKC